MFVSLTKEKSDWSDNKKLVKMNEKEMEAPNLKIISTVHRTTTTASIHIIISPNLGAPPFQSNRS